MLRRFLVSCFLLLLVPLSLSAQRGPVYQPTYDQNVNNIAVYRTTAGGDTITTAKYFAGIFITKPVATDTITIYSGVHARITKMQFLWGATAPAIASVPAGFKCDSLTIIHGGTSAYTILYRTVR